MPSFDSSLSALIDHTMLAPGCTNADAQRVCEEAGSFGFAAVVVPPCFVPLAVASMAGSMIPVCSVVSFPHGWETAEGKRDQAERLLDMGATEIDMVMNVSAFLSGLPDVVENEVSVVKGLCGVGSILKVIIETAYLSKDQVAAAARLSADAGADYVKTSTGFAPHGATVEDVHVIKNAIGDRAGIKAAGGIRTREQALSLVDAGATRLGCSASVDLIEKV